MPPNFYTPWSTGGENDPDDGCFLLPQTEGGLEFWSSESSDQDTPAWDIEFSEKGPGAWDLDLSTQLAAKLLLIDSNAGQLPQHDSEDGGGAAYANPRFKTEYCRNFKEKGTCLYGDLCQFAHGRHELRRDVVRHNKYKTKLCQKFWILGYCAYGPRCNFVHSEHDVYPQGPATDQVHRVGSGLVPCGSGNGRFREFHVSYRKTSLGDSGGDSGSEQGSVVVRRPSPPVGPLSPPHIFHPEDNPLPPLQDTVGGTASRQILGSGSTRSRLWDTPFF